MIDELNRAVEQYQAKWQALLSDVSDQDFFNAQKPTAVAWKTTDRDQLLQYVDELRDDCDQIHFGWVNERWLVTMHLKISHLHWNISIIKLMERRSGSSDPIGLDHIDFHNSKNDHADQILAAELNLTWSEEHNGEHCEWRSVWFANTEAKLRTDTVLDPCIAELQEINTVVLKA